MKYFTFFSLLFLSPFVKGQNLVINPSFEDTIPCNQAILPLLPCSSWFLATAGTTDFFSENYCSQGAPINIFGFQYARTGSAFCGIGVWSSPVPVPNYREYLEGVLLDTLKSGHIYCVSFYIVNANITKFYTSNIGVYFSVDSVFDQSTVSNLPYLPQVMNTNGIIYDTLNWVQVSGTYIAGGGGNLLLSVIFMMMQIQP